LIIGIAGPSGAGKTLSALKIARGLAGGDDSKIAVIDTEGGRAQHYAPAKGEGPGPSTFGFMRGDMRAPFTPEAYVAMIAEADTAGFEVVVIDSFSHVWDGDGGLQDMHLAILDKIAGDDAWKRDKLSVGAWKEPKLRHKRMVSRLLQCRAHLVICMRAEEKLRMETIEEGGRKKTVIIQPKDLPPAERWVPIVERRFPYELTTSLLLTPAKPGFPIPIKLQDQHRAAVPLDRPLSEETGRQLAEWARGGAARPAVAQVADAPENRAHDDPGGPGEPRDDGPTSDEIAEAADRLAAAATVGMEALTAAWADTPRAVKLILKGRLDREWKATASGKNAYAAEKERGT
jgi:hypothetical protein